MDIIYEKKTAAIFFGHGKRLSEIVHMHRHLEIIYVRSGQSAAYADKNCYMLNKGDLFITFPNQIHYYKTVEPGSFMVFIFSPETIYEYGEEISKSIPDKNLITAEDAKDLAPLFEEIYRLKGEYKYVAINGYLNIVMSRILPCLKLKAAGSRSDSAIYGIMDYCSHNFRENITLDSIAKNLHLSKYYISRLINKNLHLNLNDYINNLRVSEACNLLKEYDKKISDISMEVGFGTIRSFNRSFKSITGVSPAEYRSSSGFPQK